MALVSNLSSDTEAASDQLLSISDTNMNITSKVSQAGAKLLMLALISASVSLCKGIYQSPAQTSNNSMIFNHNRDLEAIVIFPSIVNNL